MAELRQEVRDALADGWFHVCLLESIGEAELVENFERLSGTKLMLPAPRSPIERMVDEACGVHPFDQNGMRRFVEFVYDCVYTRLERPKNFDEALKKLLGEAGNG